MLYFSVVSLKQQRVIMQSTSELLLNSSASQMILLRKRPSYQSLGFQYEHSPTIELS